ncbi:uncharacterized protein SEPMUDRAFT_151411 [Sphaerulina musiva SO2202]|uniref:Uncharacterized protein n=1 Tax=Sphaerulina musiva (strain SO2202) TaxID=692275 RepID=N1QDD1_SPHMS|nr:uncharacterized protein SEPMUDRAFT_151411 [Sphaerulina musiva SO2202]EMF09355.1 hypothetical protein SEPMUDRAFT_151411 [Sphaerulina musiva SO2202]
MHSTLIEQYLLCQGVVVPWTTKRPHITQNSGKILPFASTIAQVRSMQSNGGAVFDATDVTMWQCVITYLSGILEASTTIDLA